MGQADRVDAGRRQSYTGHVLAGNAFMGNEPVDQGHKRSAKPIKEAVKNGWNEKRI